MSRNTRNSTSSYSLKQFQVNIERKMRDSQVLLLLSRATVQLSSANNAQTIGELFVSVLGRAIVQQPKYLQDFK